MYREAPEEAHASRKGTIGVSTTGVTADFMRLSSQRCQGVPFPPI